MCRFDSCCSHELKKQSDMKLILTKAQVAIILKLLKDREDELVSQGADENQAGAVRIIRKKIIRQKAK